jgi:alpha-glucosidase
MNTFTPVLRSHEGNKPWVNKQFDSDQEIIESMVKFTNIHVLLKPYFQAVEEEYHQFGYPMIRPTFMHFDYISDKSFLLGSDLYVCPVVKKRANRIEVIIPSDNWVHLFTGKKYDRGTYKIDSPLGTPPVFYKDESKYKEVFLNVYNYINNN